MDLMEFQLKCLKGQHTALFHLSPNFSISPLAKVASLSAGKHLLLFPFLNLQIAVKLYRLQTHFLTLNSKQSVGATFSPCSMSPNFSVNATHYLTNNGASSLASQQLQLSSLLLMIGFKHLRLDKKCVPSF